MDVTREQVIGHRIAAQQLDREASSRRAVTDAAILDLGVQDSGRDGASWALANRGVPVAGPGALAGADELALVWSLRVSPHFYRRSEIVEVMTAVSPFDEADASKRLLGAAAPMAKAGVEVGDAIAAVARTMRAATTTPTVKGELSTRVTQDLPEAYAIHCRPCQADHVPESLFRMAALFGGLELEPATSPPVLRRIPGWPRRPAGFAAEPDTAPEHLQPIRAYLRLLGPATPAEVAGFLDTTATLVKQHWPEDAVEVERRGEEEVDAGRAETSRTRWCGCSDRTICWRRVRIGRCWCRRRHIARPCGRRSVVPGRCWLTARSSAAGVPAPRARSSTWRSSCGARER